MAIVVTHPFVSPKADGTDSTVVQPSDWNDGHTITMAAGKIMGRDTSGAGAVQELPMAFSATWDVTFPLTTGAITGASGSTVERPAAPTAGMMRWNTTTSVFEYYSGTEWLSPLTNAAAYMTAFAPTGRLTLETGVPVSTTDQTGKTTVYYTPAGVGYAQYPSYDGTTWSAITFSELSNDTTASAVGNAGAAVAGPYQIQDLFVWNNAGVNTLTRGPKWTASSTITVTIATPGVVTHTGHGLWDGATVRFTTTGALPTGLSANVDYFVTKVNANSYKLSTTLANQVAGTYITTTGSQSGVHTAFNYTSARGTGAATTELQLLNGVYVNKYDITNGPAATKGTYVGSVYFNASSQIDLKFGSTAASWGEAVIGLWNAYNRVDVGGLVASSTDSWTYFTVAWRASEASATARVSMVAGLSSFVSGQHHSFAVSGATAPSSQGVGLNTVSAFSGTPSYVTISVGSYGVSAAEGNVTGFGYMSAVEYPADTNGLTTYGDAGVAYNQTGLHYKWRY